MELVTESRWLCKGRERERVREIGKVEREPSRGWMD